MEARSIRDHFKSVGGWVDWDHTRDEFLHGSPSTEVKGIATMWIPSVEAIRAAAAMGLNVIITHEPAFYPSYPGFQSTYDLRLKKRGLLDELGIVLLRCHDTWDRMPEVGIPDAWAEWLGFETEPRPVESYYRICLTGGMTADELAAQVADKVRPLGQESVWIFGPRDAAVHRMAVGTGAITHIPEMFALDADCILATDDGVNSWTGGLWSVDSGVPMLYVNHACAELPGMMKMADYLRELYPQVPVEYLPCGFPPGSAGG